jgi:uncharacterized protein YkwD
MFRSLALTIAMAGTLMAQAAPQAPRVRDPQALQQYSEPTPHLLVAAMASATEDSAAEIELLQLANESRHQAGVPPLRADSNLIVAARAHARLMVAQRQLSHQFAGEPSLLKRLHETGVPLNSVGENVAYHSTVEKAYEALLHSPPHRQNLLDPDFNAAGFAAFWSGDRLYVVQDFVHQTPEIAPVSRRK